MATRSRQGLARAGTLAPTYRWLVLFCAFLALVLPGCGRASPAASPATGPAAAGTPGTPIPAAACPARVGAGALSAIRFFSARTGVGVWSRDSGCAPRLALTQDGGRDWRVVGARLPGTAGDFFYSPAVAFPTPRLGWVAGRGVLDVTRDGGAHWVRVRLGGAVEAISQSGSSLWAFVAPCAAAPGRCRYRLEATTLTGASWHDAGLLPAALGSFTPLVVTRLSMRRALVALGQMTSAPAYLTTDGGARWAPVRPCAPPGYSPIALAAVGPRHAWALCLGGAAAGSSAKSLVRSTDAGQTWTVVAQDRSLLPGTPRPVPTDEGDVLAVPSDKDLWFAGVNALWGSTDGGRSWFRVTAASTAGAGGFAAFSFVSPADGWLLIPGSGLWRTTDGRRWRLA